jgi:hypothetical protein
MTYLAGEPGRNIAWLMNLEVMKANWFGPPLTLPLPARIAKNRLLLFVSSEITD